MTSSATSDVPLQVTRGCLVASIQIELDEEVLRDFQASLLERIRETRVRGVVLDVSGVDVMDAVDFELLKRTMDMTALMGATSVIVGLRPGIVSALADMDVDLAGVNAAFHLDGGFALLEELAVRRAAPSEPSEDDAPERASDRDSD